jgi:hypothetical protein
MYMHIYTIYALFIFSPSLLPSLILSVSASTPSLQSVTLSFVLFQANTSIQIQTELFSLHSISFYINTFLIGSKDLLVYDGGYKILQNTSILERNVCI